MIKEVHIITMMLRSLLRAPYASQKQQHMVEKTEKEMGTNSTLFVRTTLTIANSGDALREMLAIMPTVPTTSLLCLMLSTANIEARSNATNKVITAASNPCMHACQEFATLPIEYPIIATIDERGKGDYLGCRRSVEKVNGHERKVQDKAYGVDDKDDEITPPTAYERAPIPYVYEAVQKSYGIWQPRELLRRFLPHHGPECVPA